MLNYMDSYLNGHYGGLEISNDYVSITLSHNGQPWLHRSTDSLDEMFHFDPFRTVSDILSI